MKMNFFRQQNNTQIDKIETRTPGEPHRDPARDKCNRIARGVLGNQEAYPTSGQNRSRGIIQSAFSRLFQRISNLFTYRVWATDSQINVLRKLTPQQSADLAEIALSIEDPQALDYEDFLGLLNEKESLKSLSDDEKGRLFTGLDSPAVRFQRQ